MYKGLATLCEDRRRVMTSERDGIIGERTTHRKVLQVLREALPRASFRKRVRLCMPIGSAPYVEYRPGGTTSCTEAKHEIEAMLERAGITHMVDITTQNTDWLRLTTKPRKRHAIGGRPRQGAGSPVNGKATPKNPLQPPSWYMRKWGRVRQSGGSFLPR